MGGDVQNILGNCDLDRARPAAHPESEVAVLIQGP